ncbi:glutathionylspermidine synthase [Helicobacter enhydrae]|uniref:Glutathionylspermidine synthase n=1 Tax=Helicobacter enhydrae TaxID=222136 RepID=A0A1B1U3P7_9HELI|nr:glutathionylspermidine synthase family protein [Helicobacter enhydrae]ANV97376.1 glutathionylspermidine synthase [Helicobacter enhydrae]
MQIIQGKTLDTQTLEALGCEWHTDLDNTAYISNEIIQITQAEADAYYQAGNTLYDMYIEASEYVIKNDLFFELDIPPTLIEPIIQSFEEEVHWHIYGRFDFAGGLDGKPIKLLEFNADTPTMLYETAVIQWAILKANGMDENLQFNNLFESIGQNFQRMITLGADISQFETLYEGWKILFSSIRGSIEEERTVRFLQEIATSYGFQTNFCFVDEAFLDSNNGIGFDGTNYEFWFKLIPWEDIAIQEPEMALLIKEMMQNKNTIFLNPAYTLLFQSKRMLKILWDLFPNHPLLLETSFEPLGKKQVKKHAFGREGANVQILDSNLSIISSQEGIYANHKPIYQEFYELNSHQGSFYQPNVFFAYESCALGYRKGDAIIDNYSKFVSHCII